MNDRDSHVYLAPTGGPDDTIALQWALSAPVPMLVSLGTAGSGRVSLDIDVLARLVKSVRLACERAAELEAKLAAAEDKIFRLEASPAVIAKQQLMEAIIAASRKGK